MDQYTSIPILFLMLLAVLGFAGCQNESSRPGQEIEPTTTTTRLPPTTEVANTIPTIELQPLPTRPLTEAEGLSVSIDRALTPEEMSQNRLFRSRHGLAFYQPPAWSVIESADRTIVRNGDFDQDDPLALPQGEEVLLFIFTGPTLPDVNLFSHYNRSVYTSLTSQQDIWLIGSVTEKENRFRTSVQEILQIESRYQVEIDSQRFELFIISLFELTGSNVSGDRPRTAVALLPYEGDDQGIDRVDFENSAEADHSNAVLQEIIGSFQFRPLLPQQQTSTQPIPIQIGSQPLSRSNRDDPTQQLNQILAQNDPRLNPEIPEVEGVLTTREVATGAIRDFQTQAWRILGKTGEIYRIELKPLTPDLDLMLDVLDQNGRSLLPNGMQNSGPIDEIEKLASLLIPADGDYTLWINSAGYNGGAYEVNLSRAGEAQPPADVTQSGILYTDLITMSLPATAAESWTFLGHTGRMLNIDHTETESGRDSITVELFAPDGSKLPLNHLNQGKVGTAAGETGPLLLPQTGLYTVRFENRSGRSTRLSFRLHDAFNDQTGTYLLAEQNGQAEEQRAQSPSTSRFATANQTLSMTENDELIIGFYGSPSVYHLLSLGRLPGSPGSESDPNRQIRKIQIDAIPLNEALDIAVTLYDSSGAPLMQSDQALGGIMETIEYLLLSEGGFEGGIEVKELSGSQGIVRLTVDTE